MIKVLKDLPLENRPREKAIMYGINTLSDAELLAIILRCGSKKENVIELANNIFKEYINFSYLINCDYEELIKIKGIKKVKALQILAMSEIFKRSQMSSINFSYKVRHPLDIYNYFSSILKNEKQENFFIIFMNIKSTIIKYEKLFVGGTSFSIVDVNLIFKRALLCGAKKIICMHNHPSGDPNPSEQDILLTKKINMIAKLVDIDLLDHIIIGNNTYYSLKENDKLE